jgi:hypothetical protein
MSGDPIAGRLSAWLSLAAAPGFAIMALLTAAHGGDPAAMVCSAADGSWPLGGMVPMYVLMSVVHSTPWLRLISRRRHKIPA